MGRNKGRPSGNNKPELPTGSPSNFSQESIKKDHRVTRKYIDPEGRVSAHVRTRHPNRNVDKSDPTNAGGYKH